MMRAWLLLVGGLLAACGGVDSEQQTAEALVNLRGTQIQNLRVSATVERERLAMTVEHVETLIARANAEQVGIIDTLRERGIDTSVLPEVATLPPSATHDPETTHTLSDTAIPTASPVIEITPFMTATAAPPIPFTISQN